MQLRNGAERHVSGKLPIVQASVGSTAVHRPDARLGDGVDVPPAGNTSRHLWARPGSPA